MMTYIKTSKKLSAFNPMRTEILIDGLKKLSDGWGGDATKKPARKAITKAKKVLSILEAGRMPWPNITVISSGGLVFDWISLTRDIHMNIDADGDIQFVTSLKKVDLQTAQVTDHLESEGSITDINAIDHIIAWYSLDKSHSC